MSRLAKAFLLPLLSCGIVYSDVAVRVQNFTHSPSTGPVAYVQVRNTGAKPFDGTLAATFPEGWQVTPDRQPIQVKAGEMKKIPFAIEKGADLTANIYPISISVEGSEIKKECTQQIVCASATYIAPKIDGNLKDWQGSIPIRWTHEGKKTVVRTHWTKKHFYLAVEVEEDDLTGFKKASKEEGMDAVQVAIAPRNKVTGDDDGKTSCRYEILLADSGSRFGEDVCFLLAEPGMDLGVCSDKRALESLAFESVEVAVKRKGNTTFYEAAIEFKALATIKPTFGREFNLSVLVHDAGGTGFRDLGDVMNFTDADRNANAWSSWEFVQWGGVVPYDSKVEFGFSSSIH